MSKKKRVVCIEKPSEECSVRNITVGKEYTFEGKDVGSYHIRDDTGYLWWYFESYFEDAKPKKKKPKKQKGLAKREYFAAKAMNGLLSNSEWMSNYHNTKHLMTTSLLVRLSVENADSLIEELNKKKVND